MARDLYGIGRFALELAVLTVVATTPVLAEVTSVQSNASLRSLAGGGSDAGIHDVTQDLGTDLNNYQGDLEVKPLSGMRMARARSSQTSRISTSPESLSVHSEGSTDIAAETNFEENFVGAGGNVGFAVTFTLTTRASFSFSATGSVATNGKDESSESEITFGCDCASEAGPDCQAFDLDIDAEDSPDRGPTASGGRSGTIGPGTCHLSAGTFSSLGTVNQTSRTSYVISLSVAAGSDDICEGPASRWVGGASGAFDDPQNWDPPQVPSFGTGECEEALFDVGQTVDLDLSAAAALSAPALAARAAGSRTAGRLAVRRSRDLRLHGGALVLDSGALDRGASLVVGGGGKVHVIDGTLQVRHALVGDAGTGTVLVEGATSFLKTLDILTVGGPTGEGVLQLRDSAVADSAEVRVGGGRLRGTVDVSNATWHTGQLALGLNGSGELTIENAGDVESETAFVDFNLLPGPLLPQGACVGRSGGAGVDVRGVSSLWHVQALSIGGLGCVEVREQAGLVTASGGQGNGDLRVGTSGTGQGFLFVHDGGALTVGGDLVVGESGPGRLVLAESPKATRIDVAGAMLIGDSLPPAGHGSVVVEGDVTTFTDSLTSSTLHVPDGDTASGDLTILAGAQLTTTTAATIGTDATGSNAHDGVGVVDLKGTAGAEELTRWRIGESLTIGAPTGAFGTGRLIIRDATVAVGIAPEHGQVTIQHGGTVSGFGQVNALVTNHGVIRNDGVIQGPVILDGSYDPSSHGQFIQTFAGGPTVLPQLTAAANTLSEPRSASATAALGDAASTGGRAVKVPPLAQGPLVVTGDADFSNTTLVLQFVNGFAPRQGDALPILQVQGQLTGAFAAVEVLGLAPGAVFDVATEPGMATSLTDTVALPVVTLKAPKKLVETKAKGVKVTFKRTGPTTAPLSVHYAVGGSAEPGFDYVSLPGVLEIPAKKKAASLVLQPLADNFVEPTETIEIELLPGDDYAPSTVSKVTIELRSKDKKK